ncbi:hypothetical protein WMF30_03680 [Sorangium sp. So ce134]
MRRIAVCSLALASAAATGTLLLIGSSRRLTECFARCAAVAPAPAPPPR